MNAPGRPQTLSVRAVTQKEAQELKLLADVPTHWRPKDRAQCESRGTKGRTCPYASCKYHLYLDVSEQTGSIKLNFPNLEVWELPVCCALDVADWGGCSLEEVGKLLNVTRERVRQIELTARLKLRFGAAWLKGDIT